MLKKMQSWLFLVTLISQIVSVLYACLIGFYVNAGNCDRCGLYCKSCGGRCYSCLHESCPHETCLHTNCTGCSIEEKNINCPSCPDGYFMVQGYCRRCYYPNCKCTLNNECTDCLPGKYDIQNRCYKVCPNNCITCTESTDCMECALGKFNKTCTANCITTCRNGSCDIDSGTCPIGCPDNQYLRADDRCDICPRRCSSCINYQNCTSCTHRFYWGPVCQSDCHSCIGVCSKDHGCSECSGKYFRVEELNGHNCQRCPETCSTCKNRTYCSSCEDGFGGNACQHNCTSCHGAKCDTITGVCSQGCALGYFENENGVGNYCEKCPDYCEICSPHVGCEKCVSGYFPQSKKKCAECRDACINKQCDQANGICTQGCAGDWLGPHCDETCPPNCVNCEIIPTLSCVTCKHGFYGTNCENSCNSNCNNDGDGNQSCEKSNGNCTYGCKRGYWGAACDILCNTGYEAGQTNSDHTNNKPIIGGLSAVIGILLLVCAASITVNLFLLRIRHKENKARSKDTYIKTGIRSKITQVFSPENDYQGLDRNRSTDTDTDARTYSVLANEYENP